MLTPGTVGKKNGADLGAFGGSFGLLRCCEKKTKNIFYVKSSPLVKTMTNRQFHEIQNKTNTEEISNHENSRFMFRGHWQYSVFLLFCMFIVLCERTREIVE